MLVMTWVTFLFGPGLPVLFPIALFGIVVLYITNRVMVAYWHRRPPVYDSKMNETTINLLTVAPILYSCMGAWVYSNQQTFFNSVEPNTGHEIFAPANHHFDQFFNQLTPGTVFFIFIILNTLRMIFRLLVKLLKWKRCY